MRVTVMGAMGTEVMEDMATEVMEDMVLEVTVTDMVMQAMDMVMEAMGIITDMGMAIGTMAIGTMVIGITAMDMDMVAGGIMVTAIVGGIDLPCVRSWPGKKR